MARYYFHQLHPGENLIIDKDGREFTSIEAAQQEALQSIREILAHDALNDRGPRRRSLEITDAEGIVLKSVPFSAAMD